MLQCLDNPSEKAMFRNDQIKEQRERMKLQKEEVMLKNTYLNLGSELNKPVHQEWEIFLIPEKSY